MSRSRRKTPITGVTTSDSEKYDKRLANRRFRKGVNTVMRGYQFSQELYEEQEADIPLLREISDVWAMDKDGKHRWKNPTDAMMRK